MLWWFQDSACMIQCLEVFGCAILFAMLLASREEAQLDGQICREVVDHQRIHMEKATNPQQPELIIAKSFPQAKLP